MLDLLRVNTLETSTPQPPGVTKLVIAGGCAGKAQETPPIFNDVSPSG